MPRSEDTAAIVDAIASLQTEFNDMQMLLRQLIKEVEKQTKELKKAIERGH